MKNFLTIRCRFAEWNRQLKKRLILHGLYIFSVYSRTYIQSQWWQFLKEINDQSWYDHHWLDHGNKERQYIYHNLPTKKKCSSEYQWHNGGVPPNLVFILTARLRLCALVTEMKKPHTLEKCAAIYISNLKLA